jgi:hypothetical protein
MWKWYLNLFTKRRNIKKVVIGAYKLQTSRKPDKINRGDAPPKHEQAPTGFPCCLKRRGNRPSTHKRNPKTRQGKTYFQPMVVSDEICFFIVGGDHATVPVKSRG